MQCLKICRAGIDNVNIIVMRVLSHSCVSHVCLQFRVAPTMLGYPVPLSTQHNVGYLAQSPAATHLHLFSSLSEWLAAAPWAVWLKKGLRPSHAPLPYAACNPLYSSALVELCQLSHPTGSQSCAGSLSQHRAQYVHV